MKNKKLLIELDKLDLPKLHSDFVSFVISKFITDILCKEYNLSYEETLYFLEQREFDLRGVGINDNN